MLKRALVLTVAAAVVAAVAVAARSRGTDGPVADSRVRRHGHGLVQVRGPGAQPGGADAQQAAARTAGDGEGARCGVRGGERDRGHQRSPIWLHRPPEPWYSQDAAAATAAYRVLIDLLPQRQPALEPLYEQSLAEIPDRAAKTGGIGVGEEAAKRCSPRARTPAWMDRESQSSAPSPASGARRRRTMRSPTRPGSQTSSRF